MAESNENPRPVRRRMATVLSRLAWLLTGAGLGAAIASLTDPRPGPERREELRERAELAARRADELRERAGETIQAGTETAAQAASRLRATLTEARIPGGAEPAPAEDEPIEPVATES